MKGITKKLMSLGLAGVMLGGGLALAGCSVDPVTDVSDSEARTYVVSKNQYIVVTEKGVATLHKGSIVVPYYHDSITNQKGYGHDFPTILRFNCGKELQTYQFVAYTQSCPTKDKYDVVCDCAYELNLGD